MSDNRIAELEAELARVKAESLRVVPVGEPCDIRSAECNFISYNSEVFVLEPHVWGWATLDGACADLDDDAIVQPVRLERWEAQADE